MRFVLRHKVSLGVLLVVVIGAGAYLILKPEDTPDWVTSTVTRGNVRELVSVSGVIESESDATLTFPTSGIVRSILVKEGDMVKEGIALATIEQSELLAERTDAVAALHIAKANRDELINGPRGEERAVTDAAVDAARTALNVTRTEEARKVANARRALLSNNLEALPTNANSSAIPPTVTGTYICDKEGVYVVTPFRSSSKSGYSFILSGLESGTYTAWTEAPGAFGTCGLSLQFSSGSSYNTSDWRITIPNTESSTYTTVMNAYLLAKEQETSAVAAAETALTKAEREAVLANALPREEALTRANAEVTKAGARLAQIEARLAERTLAAPWAGTVRDIDMTVGEVSTNRSISLITESAYVLTVRIPEIDITHVVLEQDADVVFDARPDEVVRAQVRYLAPSATEIDGVAYFEAKLGFDTPPPWLRSGLNADVDIIVGESTDTLMVPKRFVVSEGDQHYLLYPVESHTERKKVDVVFTGNDGFIAVSGTLREGDTIVAP